MAHVWPGTRAAWGQQLLTNAPGLGSLSEELDLPMFG